MSYSNPISNLFNNPVVKFVVHQVVQGKIDNQKAMQAAKQAFGNTVKAEFGSPKSTFNSGAEGALTGAAFSYAPKHFGGAEITTPKIVGSAGLGGVVGVVAQPYLSGAVAYGESLVKSSATEVKHSVTSAVNTVVHWFK